MTETKTLERDQIQAGSVSSRNSAERITERLRYLAYEEREKATNIPLKSPEFTYTVGLANGLRMAAAIVEREFKA